MKTETPRTDAACGIIHDGSADWAQTFEQCAGGDYVRAEFARQLERELEREKAWKNEDPRMLREQIRVADSAYQRLYEESRQLVKDAAFNKSGL